MDAVPDIAELIQHVRLSRNSNTRIHLLAKCLGVFDKDIKAKGQDRLELVFRRWKETKGIEATRRKMVESLHAVNEKELATTYIKYIISVQQCK